ncbi:Transcription initiation factor TFIID 23-30kDa subunit [Penicillium bovifimosum]|uniref:Transcription initiation factor TFIID 23-30kDa subunit n=1 Tax=Penicillium bovifimosum TaxID=126998 RepID=A0A9W9GHN1_9EURO|nr:Transcription initiation factor TFIID 23-30kDa subunit [Penicillium bovifimosum]KAJ5120454.1 Transcription initiation factor TFIID 23-30kDa subunit [Penicillium bovifimosum]
MADSQTPQPPTPQNGVQDQSPPPQSEDIIKTEPDLDASIENDVDMATDKPTEENEAATAPGQDPMAPAPEPSKKETSLREFLSKMDDYAPIVNPRRSHSSLPHSRRPPPPGTGPGQTPPHLARLLALAAQKFVSDIAADSYQFARIRASNSSSANNAIGSLAAASGLGAPAGAGGVPAPGGDKGKAGTHLGIQRPGFGGGGSGGSGQGRTVLTMEDLGMAVAEYGVSVKRGEFYR